MALNCSCRSLPARVSDDNVISPMRILNGYIAEGVSEKNGEGYSNPWHSNRGEWKFNFGTDRADSCGSSKSTSNDIVDLLPPDPFGMDIQSTFTAIKGWLHDLEVDYGGYVRSTHGTMSQEDYQLCAGWNFIWNSALMFQPFLSNLQFNEKLNIGIQPFSSNAHVYEKPCLDARSLPSSIQFGEKLKVEGAANIEEVPHEALAFAIGYLGVKDLLSVERVCRSLCSTVRGDPLLWRSIHIDQPLNERITDDGLVKLTRRAEGSLQCLSLVECPKITDDGLRRILETNPRLIKLYIPGCTRLSIEGVVNNIKTYNSKKDVRGIKYLRIGGIYGVIDDHFRELKSLLSVDEHKLECSRKRPHFYHRGNFYLPFDDDRAIDVEMCPRCAKVRLVYDCPDEGCRVKDEVVADICRGCTLCIPRCSQCGRCINDNEYEETFCLELICLDCFKQLNNEVEHVHAVRAKL